MILFGILCTAVLQDSLDSHSLRVTSESENGVKQKTAVTVQVFKQFPYFSTGSGSELASSGFWKTQWLCTNPSFKW